MSELVPPSKGIGPGLAAVAAKHPEMVVIAADNAPVFTGMNVYETFPGRAFDVGIAEQNMVTTAAGMATCGKMPFVMAYGNFLALRCAEQIRTFVAHTRRNVKLIGGLSGLSGGKEGPTHESSEDLAHVRAIPELVVLAPTDAVSAEKAVVAAAEWEGPVYISIGRTPSAVIYNDSYEFKIGKADLHRNGTAATIVSTGHMLAYVLEAGDRLAEQGLNVRILDMQTIKPLDEEAVLAAARETGAIVTVEEHTVIGGLGGAVAEYLSGVHPVPVIRVGINDEYSLTGRPEELMVAHGLTPENIVRAVRRALELKRP